MKSNRTKKYCCERFAQCSEEGSIYHCGKEDETEWAMKGFYHLYYCPFCGDFIKGQGWGEYDKKQFSVREQKEKPPAHKGVRAKESCPKKLKN